METIRRSTRRTREQAKRLKQLTEAQAALGWGVILIMVALLGVIYLNQASGIAAIGRRVQSLQGNLENLKRENAVLERDIAEAQSLERLQQEALRLGFIQSRPDDIEYIVVPNYPAEASTLELVAESTGKTPPPETMGEVLWLALKARVGNMIYGEASEQ